MIYNSFAFLVCFPFIFLLYYLIPARFKKSRNAFLLLVSYLLYINWKPVYALILLGITVLTYLTALLVEHYKDKTKTIMTTGVVVGLLPLLFFKYFNFINETIYDTLSMFGLRYELQGLNWAVPVGISFFTFQAIGYVWDVYYKKIAAERDFLTYALFISFFPSIVSGPINKASLIIPQLKNLRPYFDYAKAVRGLRMILWGMFMKVVLADRIGSSIDSFSGTLETESGLMNLTVALLYSFQIYGDFAGYSFMALGVGELLGFELINNFRRPYLSQSVTEFWHRWHISLSVWLRDYIYIPLGGSRCSKFRNYINIMITFLVSGLWHGANWTFVAWGGMHGFFQIFEKMLGWNKNLHNGVIRVLRIFVTYIIVSFAWIFFRQPTFSAAWNQIVRIVTNHDMTIHYSKESVIFMTFALGVVTMKDVVDECQIKGMDLFHGTNMVIRWFFYMFLLASILLAGVFDTSQFIYINF